MGKGCTRLALAGRHLEMRVCPRVIPGKPSTTSPENPLGLPSLFRALIRPTRATPISGPGPKVPPSRLEQRPAKGDRTQLHIGPFHCWRGPGIGPPSCCFGLRLPGRTRTRPAGMGTPDDGVAPSQCPLSGRETMMSFAYAKHKYLEMGRHEARTICGVQCHRSRLLAASLTGEQDTGFEMGQLKGPCPRKHRTSRRGVKVGTTMTTRRGKTANAVH